MKLFLIITLCISGLHTSLAQTVISYRVTGVSTKNMNSQKDAATLKQFSGKQIEIHKYSDHIQVFLPGKTIYARPNSNYKNTFSYFEAKGNRDDEGTAFHVQGVNTNNGQVKIFIEEINFMSKITTYKPFLITLTCQKTR